MLERCCSFAFCPAAGGVALEQSSSFWPAREGKESAFFRTPVKLGQEMGYVKTDVELLWS